MNSLSKKTSSLSRRKGRVERNLNKNQLVSVMYHDFFDYPLKRAELERWRAGKKLLRYYDKSVDWDCRKGYFFIKGRVGLIKKRDIRENLSKKKMQIAKGSVDLLSKVPQVKMVAVTGSLAMGNSDEGADIDLIIITSAGTLWTTRLVSYVLLRLFRKKVRWVGEKKQQDKLCLNIWLDENNLVWSKHYRNAYTAHEIAQVVPIVNKDSIYERFLSANSWARDYWLIPSQKFSKKRG